MSAFAERQKRSRVALITVLVIASPFLLWQGWLKISDKFGALNFNSSIIGQDFNSSIIGQADGATFTAMQAPARMFPLAQATPSELKDAFIFYGYAFFPDSDWMYVQLADAQSGEGRVIDHAGSWGSPAPDYSDPNFAVDVSSGLFPARKGELWGFINARGAWVIPPQYNQVGGFRNGVSEVYVRDSKGSRASLIDTEGKAVGAALTSANALVSLSKEALITRDAWFKRNADGSLTKLSMPYSAFAPFDNQTVIGLRDNQSMLLDHSGNPVCAEPFEQLFPAVKGRAAAKKNGKWGVIDARGDWLLVPQFDHLNVKEDGTLLASQQGKLLTLDSSGRPLPADRPAAIAPPSEGLTAACQALRCGYTDQAGNWVIAPQFDYAFAFSDGAARVGKNGLIAYIDRTGRYLTPEPPANAAAPWLWRPDSIGDGSRNNGGVVYGYIDRSGRFVIPPVFSLLGDFSENLAPAQSHNDGGSFGYITPDGNWAIPPVFIEAGNFSEGLAAVRGGRPLLGNHGYIDTQGNIKIALSGEINAAGNFKNGSAKLSSYNRQQIIIDKSGNEVDANAAKIAPPIAAALQRLSLNGGKWGYADAEDRFVITPKFDEARDFYSDYAAVKIEGKWGFIDRAGVVVVQPHYDDVGQFNEGLVRVKQNERWSYIDIKGQELQIEDIVVAGDFHDGRAKVGIDLDAAKKRAADIDITTNKLSDFIPGFPLMLSEGSDMVRGVAFVKLSRGGYYDTYRYRYALIDKQGQLIIPEHVPTAAK